MAKAKCRSAYRAAVIREVLPEPRQRVPFRELLTIPSLGVLHVVCLSERILAVPTHWDASAKKVIYCPGGRACPRCREGWPFRCYGYGACQRLAQLEGAWELEKKFMLRIPQSALVYSPGALLSRQDLRGRVLSLRRFKAKAINAPVAVEVGNPYPRPEELAPAWDVAEDLAARWGLSVEYRQN